MCIFKVHNVSQWPNLRHLAEPLGGAVGLTHNFFDTGTLSRINLQPLSVVSCYACTSTVFIWYSFDDRTGGAAWSRDCPTVRRVVASMATSHLLLLFFIFPACADSVATRHYSTAVHTVMCRHTRSCGGFCSPLYLQTLPFLIYPFLLVSHTFLHFLLFFVVFLLSFT